MNRIALFGFALTCSASVLACATVDESEPTPVRDSGTTDSTAGDATSDSSTDAPSDTKTDTGAEVPEKCTPPLTDKRACGKCGTQTRSCQATGTWGSWGTCTDEDPAAECSIGEKRTTDCGNCGKQNDTCDNTTCTWNAGTCSGEGECAPGEIKTSTASCTVPGEVRTLTCSATCKYPDVLSVPCAAPKGWITMAAAPSGFEARFKHSGVWTGKEAIFWGGFGAYVSPTYAYAKKNGAAYNVLSDTWRLLDSTTQPAALNGSQGRFDHAAVWTGSQMIIFGGCETSYSLSYYGCYSSYGTPKADGGIYDPTTDKWTALPAVPSTFVGRSGAKAIWSTTTNEMIVWGGFNQTCNSTTYSCADGAAYEPSTGKWRLLPAAPITGRWGHAVVWSGTEMIVWGGATGTPSSSSPGTTLKDGARFDPKTNVWTKFPDPGADIESRVDMAAEWSGKEMLIFGGWGSPATISYGKNTGARYIPGGSWTSFKIPADSDFSSAGSKRFAGMSWFGGGKLYYFGGGTTTYYTAYTGAATYDPATDTWASLDTTDAPTARARASIVWTGKEAVIWGGSNYVYGSTYYADGKVYRP